MRDVWKSALEWYIYFNDQPRKERYARIIMAVKDELQHITNKGDLSRHYMATEGLTERVAAQVFPNELWLDARQTEDVAYAMRCLELSTGKKFDLTRKLPSPWLIETVA